MFCAIAPSVTKKAQNAMPVFVNEKLRVTLSI